MMMRVVCASIRSFLFVALAAHAESRDIYAATDGSGRTVYTTSKSSPESKPLPLPTIGRWDPASFKKPKTAPTCEQHGGVDCEAGADIDASVVCRDGYRGALTQHQEYCAQAVVKPLSDPVRDARNPNQIQVTIQNSTAALARDITVEFVVNKFDPTLQFTGPQIIEPYSVADYVLEVRPEVVPLYRKLIATDIRASCGNSR